MTSIKALIARTIPEPLLFEVKKQYYALAVRRFSIPHVRVLRALVRSGDCALDLGANVGWYSRILSELVGPAGRVYSVEPVPPTFALLSHCVRKLRLDNVEPINLAVSDGCGSVVMEVPTYDGGGENFYQAHIVDGPAGGAPRRQFRVSITSVDALCRDLTRPVAFIKCDVEGHEWPAIRGASEVIRRCPPAMLVETTTDPDVPGTSCQALFAWLGGVGYGAYRLDKGGLVARRPGDRSVDYFFLTARHASLLEAAHVRLEGLPR